MKATRYNATRAGSLWLVEELPPALRRAGGPGSEAFANEVRVYQSGLSLVVDGKLGPETWKRIEATLDDQEDEAEIAKAPLRDVRVDSRSEALATLAEGLRFSSHLAEMATEFVDVLQGKSVGVEVARALVRAMRRDGQFAVAEILRKGGRDAENAYAYKNRDADAFRKAYSKRWHKWIQADRRYGLGTHWTGGTGSAFKAARYLVAVRPGRVSSNVFIDYDGSVLIVFPTVLDEEIGDDALGFTAHGAHNPACIGTDFTSPGFLERRGGSWRAKGGAKLSPEIVAACGVIRLDDVELRSWPARSPVVPWLRRDSPGRIWSVKDFLAPTWAQMASYIVLGRCHAAIYGWTSADPVVVGHYQRTDSRADPFYFFLRWCREAILDGDDLLDPDSWLARVNPEEVSDLGVEYRRDVAGSGW